MKNPTRRARVVTLALALGVLPLSAYAEGKLSEASELSATVVGSLIAGSALSMVGVAELVVESVEWLADGVRCTLRGSEKLGRVVLMLPVKAVGAVSLAAGQTVMVTTEVSGWLLTKAGEVVAFIPNQAGRALLFSEPVQGH